MQIRPAGEAELPFIMAVERLDGYEALVGHWDEARHRAALADGTHRYFLAEQNQTPVGFVILHGWKSPDRCTLVRRIAMLRPGQGDGRAFLREVVATVFRETQAHRISLGLFTHNVRARRAYEAAGFVAEGIARDSAFSGGVHQDQLVMALLRSDGGETWR